MFADQKDLAISFYRTALMDYVNACENMCNLYSEGRSLEVSDQVRASTRFKASYDKLKTVVKISNYKFGTRLTMPHMVLHRDWFSKVQ
jgi:hypothetical protein